MKRNRIVYFFIWILSLVCISLFGGTISYGFFALVTAVPVISLLYLLYVKLCFKIYQELDSNRLVVGNRVPFSFQLLNEFPFAFAGVRVLFYSSFSAISGLDDETTYELLPGEGIQRETSLVCRYRGEYEVGIKKVEMQDYFRLFRFTYRNPEPLRVQVKPRTVWLEEIHSVDLSMAASGDSMYRDTQPDVLVREYLTGDDLRQVHWKTTARQGQLMVRRRIGEEQRGVGILLGTWRQWKEESRYLPVENKLLESALALSLFFAGRNIPVNVWYLQNELISLSLDSLGQYDNLYDRISGIHFEEDYTQEKLWVEAAGQSQLFQCRVVFLLIQKMGPETDGMVRILKENNIQTVICEITEEMGAVKEKTARKTDDKDQKSVKAADRHAVDGYLRIPADADLREVM